MHIQVRQLIEAFQADHWVPLLSSRRHMCQCMISADLLLYYIPIVSPLYPQSNHDQSTIFGFQHIMIATSSVVLFIIIRDGIG